MRYALIALFLGSLCTDAAFAQILEMTEVEKLHVVVEECESEYPSFNAPSPVTCVKARGRLMGHYGSDEALREGAANLKAAALFNRKRRNTEPLAKGGRELRDDPKHTVKK
ncbi:MAG TPA: hypothetical protein VF194_18400 [Ferrovibrio sp.]|uniref:hypothetical protein n=1 Tax=Ferrovibrio sp. TaxID=1917215 RepID=UPI002ECFAF0A